MIRPEDVPLDVIAAYLRCGDVTAREVIAAALNAWPKAFTTELEDYMGVYRRIILPLDNHLEKALKHERDWR